MKTARTANLKDNVAAATLLTATFIAIMGSIVTSRDANATKAAPHAMEVQRMNTILITAPRLHRVATLETIVVTASRYEEKAARVMLASN